MHSHVEPSFVVSRVRSRQLRLAAALLTTAVIASLVGSVTPAAAATVVASGQLDASRSVAERYEKVDFVPVESGTHTFTLAWTGTGFLHVNLKLASTKDSLVRVESRTSPLTFTADLTANTPYFFGIWNSDGLADYTLTVDTASPPPPPPGDGLIASVSLDASEVTGPIWAPIKYRSDLAGEYRFAVRWADPATINSRLRNRETRVLVDEQNGSNGELIFTATLDADVPYWFGLRIDDGATNVEVILLESPTTPDDNRPNIIVINTDDQRADSLSFLPKIRSWLGDGGRTYTNALVTTPSCCPSRASLLSGQYVHNHGVVTQLTPALNPDNTIQHYLHDAGYFTGHSGKYLHYIPLNEDVPHWDRWTYFRGGYRDVTMNFDGSVTTRPGYSTTITFDRAIDYVQDWSAVDDAKPFYLHLTPVAPHSPFDPEDKYIGAAVPPVDVTPALTEADRSDKPSFVRNRTVTYFDEAEKRAQRIRMLYSVDDQVDRLMTFLQAEGELDNTLVIFTSDNGYLLGEHQLTSKFVPYSEAVDVPFLMRWPGHIAEGSTDDRLVANIDIAPTVLAAAEVAAEHTLDGRDVLSPTPRQRILSEYFYDERNSKGIPDWASTTTPTYRYNEYYEQGTDIVSFREYYDLVNDPFELVNLFADGDPANDPAVAPLRTQLLADRSCIGAACP